MPPPAPAPSPTPVPAPVPVPTPPPPDPTPVVAGVEAFSSKVLDSLADILKNSSSPAVLEAQALLLRRLATEGDVFPSRVPAPKNITEIGGYLNLLETIGQTAMRDQALGAILGVAGPSTAIGSQPAGPLLYDVPRSNDRPAGAAQPTYPTLFMVRNDFAAALDVALKTIHDAGCMLPLNTTPIPLPSLTPAPSGPVDFLGLLGRTLSLSPAAALTDADNDPLALARVQGGAPDAGVVARQLDAAAPQAGTVATQKWIAWACTATACSEGPAANRLYLSLAPVLNTAGWYQSKPTVPQKLAMPGSWARWTNITGLVSGSTHLGDELMLRYSGEQIGNSSLRESQHYVWDGTTFMPPS